MRLDVALVHGLGVEGALDHEIGLGEARRDVADRELDPLGDVGGLVRRRLDACGEQVLVQQRRVVRHRLDDVDHVRQRLVLDLDQLERLLGDVALVAATAATAWPS